MAPATDRTAAAASRRESRLTTRRLVPDFAPIETAARLVAVFACLYALLLAPQTASATDADCPPDRLDEHVSVFRVTDGDTLILTDRRRVRLIGVNTPELARDRRPAEAFAREAHAALRKLVAASANRIALRFDGERFDRYSRVLAHVFSRDGRNLQAALLKEGLGAAIAFPGNLWQQPCYHALSMSARERKLGIWSLRRYQGIRPVEVAGVRPGSVHAVAGRIQNVRRTRGSFLLDMGHDFALFVHKDDLRLFDAMPLHSLRHRRLRAIGWISARNSRYSLRVRHPSQLQLLE